MGPPCVTEEKNTIISTNWKSGKQNCRQKNIGIRQDGSTIQICTLYQHIPCIPKRLWITLTICKLLFSWPLSDNLLAIDPSANSILLYKSMGKCFWGDVSVNIISSNSVMIIWKISQVQCQTHPLFKDMADILL